MPKELIIVIDPQKDFINENGGYSKRHKGISQILNAKKNINKLLLKTENQKVAIVISDYHENQFEKELSLCIPGTEGHEIDIKFDNTTKIITKKKHSCFSSDYFNDYLLKSNISSLIICGFLAEYCVRQTGIDGLKKGVKITLIKNAIGTGDDVQHRRENMFTELEEMGAKLINNYGT